MTDYFGTAASEPPRNSKMGRWFDDCICYDGLYMRRYAAFELAEADHLGLDEIQRIIDLPTTEPPGRLMTAAEAFQHRAVNYPVYANVSRDV